MAFDTSDQQWRAAISVCGFRVATRSDQAHHHVEVAVLTSGLEWRAAMLIRDVRVAIHGDEKVKLFEVSKMIA